MHQNAPDQWLIRTAENKVSGPFTRQQICQFIQQGKLQLNDEVSQANTYWFYLHEQGEIKKFLGIELPKALYARTEEQTETDVDKSEERTDPDLLQPAGARAAAMGTSSAARGGVRPREESVLELSEPIEEIGENTAVMSNRAFRDYRQKKNPETASEPGQISLSEQRVSPSPVVRGATVDRSKLYRIFTGVMIVGAIGLLFALLKILHDHPHR